MEFFKRATEDLARFSNSTFHGNTIKKIISFNSTSLWWFYEISIRISYFEYLRYKKMLSILSEKSDISSAVCDIWDPILLSAVNDYCTEQNIPLKVMPPKKSRLKWVKQYFGYGRYGVNYFLDFLLSQMYNRRLSAEIVIASYTNYWTRYNVTKESSKDGIFQDIQRKLKEHGIRYIGIEYNNESFINYIKTRYEKRRYARGKWVPLCAFATLATLTKAMKIYKRICADLSKVSFEDNRKETENIVILKLLKNHVRTSFFLISDILSTENALASIKPRAVLTSCEYCKMGRAAIIAGNKAGMITFALQHGIITPFHWGYIFSRSEETSFIDASDSRPLSKYTMLYGTGDLQLLLNESTYPAESLIVTGQPRYDHLYSVMRSMDKETFIKENNLKLPLLIWASQNVHPSSETEKDIRCISHLLDTLPEIYLFIKPHPGERDLSIYDPLARRENVTISKNINLYKLLNVCSMMITKNSTTAMEAAAIDKPVIVLNLSGEPDVCDYVTEGIALGVYRERDLPPAVEKLLRYDPEMRKKRANYVEKHLYKVDGESSERVVRFIEEMMNVSPKA